MRERPARISKVLSANDVGDTGAHQAGMLVPKESSVLAFFPTLNPRDKNPRCSLSLRDDWQDRWTFAFIYYNNRFFGGTRNEYRLTRMTDFLRRRNAKPGDTIILTRDENDSYRITIERFAQEQPLAQEHPPAQGRLKLGTGWKVVQI
jgi:hypothetical protein